VTVSEPSLVHMVLNPRSSAGNTPSPALILLHGRGADEKDLAGIAGFLDDRLLIISARAPYRFANGGGYAWYDMDDAGAPDETMLEQSYLRLTRFVHECIAVYHADPQQLYLLGFSMGTMMAYALSLTTPRLFRGVVANSGFVQEPPGHPLKWNELSGTGFFITHGLFDPVIPVARGRESRDLFRNSNAEWVYREYPMGHEISLDSLSEASGWLTSRIDQYRP